MASEEKYREEELEIELFLSGRFVYASDNDEMLVPVHRLKELLRLYALRARDKQRACPLCGLRVTDTSAPCLHKLAAPPAGESALLRAAKGRWHKKHPNSETTGWDERDYKLWSDLGQLKSYGRLNKIDHMVSLREVEELIRSHAEERFNAKTH